MLEVSFDLIQSNQICIRCTRMPLAICSMATSGNLYALEKVEVQYRHLIPIPQKHKKNDPNFAVMVFFPTRLYI